VTEYAEDPYEDEDLEEDETLERIEQLEAALEKQQQINDANRALQQLDCFTQAVRLDNVTSRARALAAYAAKADALADGRWIFTTTGWTVRQFDEPGMLTLAELDAASPDNPVWVQGFGFQGVQVNMAALEAAGLGPGSPGVAVDANGQPTGQLTGPAVAQAGAGVVAQLDALSIDERPNAWRTSSPGRTAWVSPLGRILRATSSRLIRRGRAWSSALASTGTSPSWSCGGAIGSTPGLRSI
jgi:hypothetical protein